MAEASPPRRGQSQGASSVASYVGDDRDAWSCPLPNEIFEVGSQGQDEDIAALGVAIALRNHHAWCTPVRHASQTLDSPSTFLAALTFFALPAWQGWLPALFNEKVVPLTGLGAPLPSFPFADQHLVLEQPPPRVMLQFVKVLVARFRMSVAEIVLAYCLVSPHTATSPLATHHPQPHPTHLKPVSTQ